MDDFEKLLLNLRGAFEDFDGGYQSEAEALETLRDILDRELDAVGFATSGATAALNAGD